MKRTLLVAAMFVVFTGAANATGKHEKPVVKPVQPVAQSSSKGVGVGVGIAASNSKAEAASKSTAVANGGLASSVAGAAGGSSTASGGNAVSGDSSASNGNQSQSLTVNNVAPDDVKIRNVPSVNPWAAAPTATCVVTTGGSVAVPGFGGGLSTGTIDRGCEARENFRALAGVGLMVEAVRVLCRQNADVAREVKECEDIHSEFVKRDNDRARSVTPGNQFNMNN